MLASILPVVVTLVPFAIIIFLVYHFVGKKAGKITGIAVLGAILLAVLAFALLSTSSSETENAVTLAGEKVISRVVEERYPGAHYSVEGRVKTLSGKAHNEYHVDITADYNETSYTKFNKDVCSRLGESNADLITSISKGGLSPRQGKGGNCEYWLSTK